MSSYQQSGADAMAWGAAAPEPPPRVVFRPEPAVPLTLGGGAASIANDLPGILRTIDNQLPSAVTRRFFSPDNVDYIQSELRRSFVAQTGARTLGRQGGDGDFHLVAIMRAQFMRFSIDAKAPRDPAALVDFLNTKVLEEAVPIVVANYYAKLRYLRDKFGPLQVMDRGINTSLKGLDPLARAAW